MTYDEIVELYIATFNRAPDTEGITYWMNSGLSLEEIAQSFFDQEETENLYADMTTADFIDSVYQNVLDRMPDEAGKAYWLNELDTGNISQDKFILAVVNAAKEHAEDAQTLEAKILVGTEFAQAGLNDTELAKDIMDKLEEGIDAEVITESIVSLKEQLEEASLDSVPENIKTDFLDTLDSYGMDGFGRGTAEEADADAEEEADADAADAEEEANDEEAAAEDSADNWESETSDDENITYGNLSNLDSDSDDEETYTGTSDNSEGTASGYEEETESSEENDDILLSGVDEHDNTEESGIFGF